MFFFSFPPEREEKEDVVHTKRDDATESGSEFHRRNGKKKHITV